MTKRDVAVAVISAAIVAAAMYYGGPRGGEVAKEVVVPVVERVLREDNFPDTGKVVEPHTSPHLTTPSQHVVGTDDMVRRDDLAYYRLLLRDGVFPVIQHEVRP